MTDKTEEKRKRAERARELLLHLENRYPDCFTRDARKVQPLMIGIQKDLRAALAEAEETKETPGWLVRQALAQYVRTPRYLKAIIEKRPRIGLDGAQAGEITDQEQAHAREQLEALDARRAERRKPSRPARKPKEDTEEKTRRKLEQLAAKFAKE